MLRLMISCKMRASGKGREEYLVGTIIEVFLLVSCGLIFLFLIVGTLAANNKKKKVDAYNEKVLADAPAAVKEMFQKIADSSISIDFDELQPDLKADILLVGKINQMSAKLEESCTFTCDSFCSFAVFPNYLVTKGLCLRLDDYTGISCTSKEQTHVSIPQSGNEDKQKSVIGSAVVGGVLAGGAGAVVGAIAAADHNARHPVQQPEEMKTWKLMYYYLSMQRADGGADTVEFTFPKVPYRNTNYDGSMSAAEFKYCDDTAIINELFSRAIPNGRNLYS